LPAINYALLLPLLFGSPFAGLLADKFNRKLIACGSMCVMNMSMFFIGFSQNFGTVFFLYLLFSFGLLMYGPGGVSLVIDYYPAKLRTFVMGAVTIGGNIGSSIGSLLPAFIGLSGWRWTFFELEGTFSIFALLGILFVKEPKRGQFTIKGGGEGEASAHGHGGGGPNTVAGIIK